MNYKFSSDKVAFGTTKDNLNIYKVFPDEVFETGSAIAEIDNDIPFDKIYIISHQDTISASNVEDIKALFDRKTFGGFKTPYNITVK